MQTLVLISLITIVVWLLYSALRYGTGEYVSDNYYITKEKWLFSVVMVLTAGLLFLPMLSKSEEYGCFAFLSCMGLILVGTEPHYKTYGKLAHNVGACTACASSLIWSALFHPYITACVFFAYLAYYIAVGKKVMYVGEISVFALVYFNLLY
ncbi:hypothetical protein [Prevotella sp. oral taxon 299]|uniref:hypothetical protein n=1 Tax=Prevotella sp. oral taxon 299 TaxID=652716 RepID=UPI0001C3F824|nr:hypothetical protein [Prevotella sp. oral taxon 299]EFC71555.1 hypothetical protein HMPREF0669_00227 [Prevotella sp. oral taxon 299 str. F0039]